MHWQLFFIPLEGGSTSTMGFIWQSAMYLIMSAIYLNLILAISSTHGTRPGGRKFRPYREQPHSMGRGGIYSRPLAKELAGIAGKKLPKLG
jgi:hypothetical protein